MPSRLAGISADRCAMTDKAVLKLLSVRTPTLMYRIDTTVRQSRQLYLEAIRW